MDDRDTAGGDLLPLAGLLVLDLTLVRAGPTCVRHLSDWGAEVIRIEPPGIVEVFGGSRDDPDFQNLHRNKRTIQLDLKSPEGHAAFLRLAARADVLVENMRVPVKKRLKISFEDLHPINPRLVYGSISGFGQDGPYSDRPGFDQIAQGMGGLMSITGFPGQGPVRAGIAVADLTAGNLLALGVMTALYERHRTGLGRWVHTSLLEAQIFMLDFQAARYLMRGEVAKQTGNSHALDAMSGVYETSDGCINISGGTTQMWLQFCDVLGHPEWKSRPQWLTGLDRVADRAGLAQAVSSVTRTRTYADLFEALAAGGIPAGPVNAIDEVFADPQVIHLGIAQGIRHPRLGEETMVGSPLTLSGVPKEIRTPPPEPGQHTEEVLREFGYSPQEIAAMRQKGVV